MNPLVQYFEIHNKSNKPDVKELNRVLKIMVEGQMYNEIDEGFRFVYSLHFTFPILLRQCLHNTLDIKSSLAEWDALYSYSRSFTARYWPSEQYLLRGLGE